METHNGPSSLSVPSVKRLILTVASGVTADKVRVLSFPRRRFLARHQKSAATALLRFQTSKEPGLEIEDDINEMSKRVERSTFNQGQRVSHEEPRDYWWHWQGTRNTTLY